MPTDYIEMVFAFIIGLICGVIVGWVTLNWHVEDKYREFAVKEKIAYYTNDVNGKVVFKFKSNCE